MIVDKPEFVLEFSQLSSPAKLEQEFHDRELTRERFV